jgi:hypothetical protein
VLQNPAPIISSITPSSILAGNPTPVILAGSGFFVGATVQIGNQSFPTSYVSPTSLSAQVVVPVGTTSLTVTNPAPTVGVSNGVSLTGTAAGTGLSPTVVSVDPGGNTVATDGFGGAVSSTGRYYSFGGFEPPVSRYSSATGLVFLRDTCLGAPTNCSPSTVQYTSGRDANSVGGVSADGRYVALVAGATQFYAPQLGDLCTGAAAGCVPSTIYVNANAFEYHAIRPYLTPIGRYMSYAFPNSVSGNPPVADNYQADIFDTCAGAPPGCATAQISVAIDTDSFGLILSDDGRYVPYTGLASQILLHDSCLGAPPGCSPSDSAISAANCLTPSISGDAQYVAYSCADGLKLQATCLNALPSCNPAPMQVDASSTIGPPSVSAGGRYVAYVPTAASINGQTLANGMIFVFDSCIGAGSGCKQKSVPLCLNSSGAVTTGGCSLSGMTADGQYVVFSSASVAYIVKNPLF